jgi:RNA polymerase sigma-70 factor, ECF subfamily
MGEWAGGRAFEDVLTLARAGDDVAFAELWRWLHPPLRRWLTVVAPWDVDDVESEAWLSITRSLDSFEGDERDFRRWVFTIARRRAIDWARRRRRQPQTDALDGVDVADESSSAASLVAAAAALAAALTLLRQLTVDQREVVALRVIVGMSVGETAAVVGKTEGAVRVLCHRALRTLADCLDAAELADEVAP